MSCFQTRPGSCSQTRPGISLCSLCGLQGGGQFMVLLNQSEQDCEPLSALALDCLFQTGLPPWSVNFPFHRTILLFQLLCKIMFPSPVEAILLHKRGRKLASCVCSNWVGFSRLHVGKLLPTFLSVRLVPSLWSHPLSGSHISRSYIHITISTRVANTAQQARSGSRTHSHNTPTHTAFPAQTTTMLVTLNMMTPCMWCPRILQ